MSLTFDEFRKANPAPRKGRVKETAMSFTLVWRVDPAPTGRYRSFQTRGWPFAHYKGPKERAAVYITCDDDYTPHRARTGEHAPLKIHIAKHYIRPDGTPTFTWMQLKVRAQTLDEAKALARMAIDPHPDFLPSEF